MQSAARMNVEKMNPVQLMLEAYRLQAEFDGMTQPEYESEVTQPKVLRQMEVCTRYEELTGRELF